MMANPLMSPNKPIQFLLSSPQRWRLLTQQQLTEVEELQEVTEEPTEDEDSDKQEAMIMDSNQTEEQIEEHKEEITTTLTEVLEEDKNPIEDPEDHMTTDKNPTEARGEALTIGREVEGLLSLIVIIGTVWSAEREDTTTYYTVPSSQAIFQEVIMSYQSPKRYVNSASQRWVNLIHVLMDSQRIIKIGSVIYIN